MRPVLLLGVMLLLSGCNSGFVDYLDNTITVRRNVNTPVGDSETLRRVRGLTPDSLAPITPEQGNIWPAEVGHETTMIDLISQPGAVTTQQMPKPGSPAYRSMMDGGTTPELAPQVGGGKPSMPQSVPPVVAPVSRPAVTAPAAPAASSAPPSLGNQPPGSIVIPNGNGTSTVVRPDGTVDTIPGK